MGRKHLLIGLDDDELTAVNEGSEEAEGTKPKSRPTSAAWRCRRHGAVFGAHLRRDGRR